MFEFSLYFSPFLLFYVEVIFLPIFIQLTSNLVIMILRYVGLLLYFEELPVGCSSRFLQDFLDY